MKDQKQFWDEMHKHKAIAAHSMQQTSFAEEVNKTVAAHSRLLELGCGEGNDSIYFAKQGHRVTATDLSDVVIGQNKKRYTHPNVQFIQQDTSCPFEFPDSSFDAVYARLSLHYFTDTVSRKIFTEIARVLKQGGKLCFMCKSVEDRMYGKGKRIEADMFDLDGHVRHFFSETYARDLLSEIFTVDSMQTGKEEIYGKTAGFIKVIARKV